MARIWIIVAAVAGFCAVGAGAAASHALASDVRAAALIATAAQYAVYHALALLGLAALEGRFAGFGRRLAQVAGWCFTAGIVLFSGSLVLIVATANGGFAKVTPVGGILFLFGWAALGLAALRRLEPVR